jgi:hypothetical protein
VAARTNNMSRQANRAIKIADNFSGRFVRPLSPPGGERTRHENPKGDRAPGDHTASDRARTLRPRHWSSTTMAMPLPAIREIPARAKAFGNSPQTLDRKRPPKPLSVVKRGDRGGLAEPIGEQKSTLPAHGAAAVVAALRSHLPEEIRRRAEVWLASEMTPWRAQFQPKMTRPPELL